MIKELRAWRALPKATRYDVATHAARNETLPDPAVAAIALARAQVRRRFWVVVGPCASVVAFTTFLLLDQPADRAHDVWSLAAFALYIGMLVGGIAAASAQNLVAIEAAAVRTAARAGSAAARMPVEAGRVVLRRRGVEQWSVRSALASFAANGNMAFRLTFTLSILLSNMSLVLDHRGSRWVVVVLIGAELAMVVGVTVMVARGVAGRREPRLVLSPEGVEVPELKLRAPWSAFDRADVGAPGYALQLRLYLRSAEDFKTFSTLPAARRRAAYRQIAGAGGAIAIPMASFADAPADVLRWCWTYRSPVPTA